MQVVEMAPAEGLPPATRKALFDDAVRLTSEAKYLCAGTVEFLVDGEGRHYFIEVRCDGGTTLPNLYPNGSVAISNQQPKRQPLQYQVNPRVQVEHTVTEEVTGIDIVQVRTYIHTRPWWEISLTDTTPPTPITTTSPLSNTARTTPPKKNKTLNSPRSASPRAPRCKTWASPRTRSRRAATQCSAA